MSLNYLCLLTMRTESVSGSCINPFVSWDITPRTTIRIIVINAILLRFIAFIDRVINSSRHLGKPLFKRFISFPLS
jgi:hypothetical protein